MTLYLVDERPEPFRPLSWTRPLCELLFGAETFRERVERVSGRAVAGVFSQGRFEGLPFSRLGGSPLTVNPSAASDAHGDVIPNGGILLLDSLYVPAGRVDPAFAQRERPARFWLGGAMIGACLREAEAGEALEALAARESWRDAAQRGEDLELPGRRPEAIYRLVAENAGQILADLGEGGGDGAGPDGARPVGAGMAGAGTAGLEFAGLRIEGPRERLRIEGGAEIVGPVYVDVREGPVRIARGARVEPFSVLRGPLVVRREARLLGGEIGAGSTIGRSCKVRGEVANTIFLGFANKAHEGYIGDSYVGEWVNLGAGTTTSNMKNNYGAVRLRLPDEVVETGLLKLGSLIGDHVKTGIGTLFPTGASIGPGTNLYGTRGPAPPFLPAFSWGSGSLQETHRLEAFVESARRVMERRRVVLEDEEVGMLGAVFRATESERIAV